MMERVVTVESLSLLQSAALQSLSKTHEEENPKGGGQPFQPSSGNILVNICRIFIIMLTIRGEV